MTAQVPNPFAIQPYRVLPRLPVTDRTERTVIELPIEAHPLAHVAKTARDEPPRHAVTLHFTPDAPGRCLVCGEATLEVTLVGVCFTALDAVDTAYGPLRARLKGTEARSYKFGPCGHELQA